MYPEKYYYLISKSGFDNEIISAARQYRNVTLISFEQMCQ